jgi:hypothetical protein
VLIRGIICVYFQNYTENIHKAAVLESLATLFCMLDVYHPSWRMGTMCRFMLPLMGSQSQPTLLFVFIIEPLISSLQSHNQALHNHETENSTWVELFLFLHYRKLLCFVRSKYTFSCGV